MGAYRFSNAPINCDVHPNEFLKVLGDFYILPTLYQSSLKEAPAMNQKPG